jgi:hypothetical protein
MNDEYAPWMGRFRPGADYRFHGWDEVQGILSWLHVRDDGAWEVVQQAIYAPSLYDMNKEAEADSNGQRFGSGKIVASLPVNVAYATGFMEAARQKDQKWISRFLNDPSHRWFKRFRGKI